MIRRNTQRSPCLQLAAVRHTRQAELGALPGCLAVLARTAALESLGVIPDKISEKSKFPTNFGVAIFYGNVNNAVMKFQKGHPFLMEYMELMVSSTSCKSGLR